MQSTLEPLEGNKVKLTVEVGAAEFDRAVDVAAKKMAREVRMPGFRPGKVPRRLLEARMGHEALRTEALRESVPSFYASALREHEVDAIAAPEIDITAGQEQGDLHFDAVVQVRPSVAIPGYGGLQVTLERPVATDQEIAHQIDLLRANEATLEAVSRPAVDGDVLTIDVAMSPAPPPAAEGPPADGADDDAQDDAAGEAPSAGAASEAPSVGAAGEGPAAAGALSEVPPADAASEAPAVGAAGEGPAAAGALSEVPPADAASDGPTAGALSEVPPADAASEGPTAGAAGEGSTSQSNQVTDVSYTLGSGEFGVAELDVALQDAKAGDVIRFDADAGPQRRSTFQVLVKGVREQNLPELTDEWVRDQTEFASIDELRDDLRQRITSVKRSRIGAQLENNAVEALVELVTEDPPAPLIGAEVERRLHELNHRLQSQGATVDQYMAARGQEPEGLVEELRLLSVPMVKADLALRALADAEGIEATESDIDEQVVEMAEATSRTPAQVRREFVTAERMPAVRSELRKAKALAWLVEHVDVVDPEGQPIDRVELGPEGQSGETAQEAAAPDDTADGADDLMSEEIPS